MPKKKPNPNNRFARPTLKDIALETGFSVNTVSRALRNMPDVTPDTREEIQRISHKLGYFNNSLASSLRLGRSNTLAVVIPDVSNLFYSIAMEEIERGAREVGYSTFLLNTSEDGQHEYAALTTALQKNVDGIIFSPAQNSLDSVHLLQSSGTPFVLLGRYFENTKTDHVVGDDLDGGYKATTYLIQKGHKNIVLLNGRSQNNSSARLRRDGYCKALAEANLPLQQDLLFEISAKGDEAASVLAPLLAKRSDITAIFAYSDLIAFEAIDGLSKLGYKVPEDISVVGFDHIQAYLKTPFRLTSMDNSSPQLARTALQILTQKIQQPDMPPQSTVLPISLFEGDSVRNIK
ncbi:MAG: LacI family DNA-binding transcriptional regulator [Oscillospiraceae bacterium]